MEENEPDKTTQRILHIVNKFVDNLAELRLAWMIVPTTLYTELEVVRTCASLYIAAVLAYQLLFFVVRVVEVAKATRNTPAACTVALLGTLKLLSTHHTHRCECQCVVQALSNRQETMRVKHAPAIVFSPIVD